MNPIKFIHNYCDFSNPNWVWMLVCMSRNKDNENGKSESNENMANTPERFMRRLVIRKPSEIEECYNELKKMANKEGTTYRMYVSLNSRDTVSTFFHFQKKLAEIGYNMARQLPDAVNMSKKISSLWKTELAQKPNRGTKRILLDIDENDKELVQRLYVRIDGMGIPIYACHPTVSGYAISCEAHDIRWIKQEHEKREIEVKRDALLFVEAWDGKDLT